MTICPERELKKHKRIRAVIEIDQATIEVRISYDHETSDVAKMIGTALRDFAMLSLIDLEDN